MSSSSKSIASRMHGTLPVLETPRLRLRALVLDDLEDVWRYTSDEETTRYTGWPRHASRDETLRFLEQTLAEYDCGAPGPFAWQCRTTRHVIGAGGLAEIDTRGDAEAGWVLNRDSWGQGLATEAMLSVIDWAFSALNLASVRAHCIAENKASLRVMEKLGMRVENHLAGSRFHRGQIVDVIGCQISHESWKQMQKK